MPDVGTSRPGSIEPGSAEAIRQVAEHEQGVRDLQELNRLRALRAFNATPDGRLVLALERIADALTRAFPERT